MKSVAHSASVQQLMKLLATSSDQGSLKIERH